MSKKNGGRKRKGRKTRRSLPGSCSGCHSFTCPGASGGGKWTSGCPANPFNKAKKGQPEPIDRRLIKNR